MAAVPSLQNVATAKANVAEERVAYVRAAVVAFNSVVYLAYLDPTPFHGLALAIIAVANLYSVFVLAARPYRWWAGSNTSRFTVTTDGALIFLWLMATGGLDSPFYLLWYLSLVAVAFRFDARATYVATGVYAALYILLLLVMDQWGRSYVDLLVRLGYLALIGILGGLLANFSARALALRLAMEGTLDRQSRFRVLAEAAREGVCIHRGGTIMDVNPALCAMTGRTKDELEGTNILDAVHPDDHPRVQQQLRAPRDEPLEVRFKRPDGSVLTVIGRGRPIPYGGESARVVTFHDVTEERAATEARLLAREKEAEVARLQRLDRLKTEFINTAAHELNTPLTPIQLQLHLLRRRITSPEDARALEIMERNMGRLGRLVGDMLDVARLQSGHLSLNHAPMDLTEVMHRAAATLGPKAQAEAVRLEVEGDAVLMVADAERLEQVGLNLMANALRFTPEGGTVRVACRADGTEAVLEVVDNGVGMDAHQAAALFQPFSQQHGAIGGLGLGLYICQGIVKGHGGTISVASQGPGEGSTFLVRLPLRPEDATD